MPWPEPGLSSCSGGGLLDVTARFFTPAGVPLLAAPEVAACLGIRARTVYEWRRRGYLRERGLDDQGRALFDAAEVAEVHATPGARRPVR